MSTEITTGKKWIYNTLLANTSIVALVTNDGEIGIYADYARKVPCVVYQTYSIKEDTMAIGGGRVKSNIQFMVKAIDRSDNTSKVEQIASLIDQSLHKKSGILTEGTVISCIRRLPFNFIEKNPESTYQHLGGIYRLEIQSN
jgi:hypothetical protein